MQRRLLAVAGGFVLVCVLLEVGLRLASVSYPVFDTFDRERGVALRPGKRGWYREEGEAELEINRHGYRDREHELEKPPGTYRIAVLGDSFTEARQVALEETYWKRMEARLNEGSDAQDVIEVLGFGVWRYGTAQELLTLRRDVLAFEPDLVLLAFFVGNDVSDNSRALTSYTFRPFPVLDGEALSFDDSFREFTFEYVKMRFLLGAIHRSRTLELFNELRRRQGVQRQEALERERLQRREVAAAAHPRSGARPASALVERGLSASVLAEPTSAVWNEAWRVTEALIARMHAESCTAGARFALVVIPSPIRVHPDPSQRERLAAALGVDDLGYGERRIAALGARLGFPVLVLAERMAAVAVAEKRYFHGFENSTLGAGHWNAAGHALAADLIADDLEQAGLVP